MVTKAASIKGTYLFGGLGTDGAYADQIVAALTAAGISNACHADIWPWRFCRSLPALSTLVDASWGVLRLRSFGSTGHVDKANFSATGPQLNLIGYSYGALIACQLARELAGEQKVTIDHLVLIAAPVSPQQLRWLKHETRITHHASRITHIHILNLTERGDPIFVGIPFWRLMFAPVKLWIQFLRKSGHFIYTKSGPDGDTARRNLADELSQRDLK